MGVFLSGDALALEKCIATDGSVTYAGRCPAGTTRAPSRTDPAPPPKHKGTTIIKPDPYKGFKPVAPAPEATPPAPAAPVRPPQPSPVRIEHYEIQAGDEAGLLAALQAQGLSHARSSWKLAYEYGKREAPGRCSVSGVSTALDLTVTLPRWSIPDRVGPQLRERWARYVQALSAHEEKRLEHARELERALGNALATLPPAPDCAALDAAVKARYEALAAQAREKDTEYDARARRREIPLPAF